MSLAKVAYHSYHDSVLLPGRTSPLCSAMRLRPRMRSGQGSVPHAKGSRRKYGSPSSMTLLLFECKSGFFVPRIRCGRSSASPSSFDRRGESPRLVTLLRASRTIRAQSSIRHSNMGGGHLNATTDRSNYCPQGLRFPNQTRPLQHGGVAGKPRYECGTRLLSAQAGYL